MAKSESLRGSVFAAFVFLDKSLGADHPPRAYVGGMGSGTRSVGFAKFGRDDAERLRQWKAHRLFTLEDGHAEVMARRALHVYLLQHMCRMVDAAQAGASSDDAPLSPTKQTVPFYFDSHQRRFVWKADVELHLVVTQVPCGSFGVSPAVPEWSTGAHVLLHVPQSCAPHPPQECVQPSAMKPARAVKTHMGHAVSQVMDEALHLLRGVPRTKPGAGTPSLSMSCSDKIIRWCREGIEGKCLRRLFTTTKYLNAIHVGSRPRTHCGVESSPRDGTPSVLDADASTPVEQSLSNVWEADIHESFRVAMELAGVDHTPLLSWFNVNNLNNVCTDALLQTPRGGCGVTSSVSMCVWPAVHNTHMNGWGACALNTKDGVVFGMTQSRFLANVEAATRAACTGNEGAALKALCNAVVRTALVEENDAPAVSAESLVQLGCGGCPVLRWSLGIRAASVWHNLLRMEKLADPARRTTAASQDAATALWDAHPYFAFVEMAAPPLCGLWVNKWRAAVKSSQ